MKKIILAIFLLSISSNALAKVEIWHCDMYIGPEEEYYKGTTTFKIDTGIPKIFWRKNSQWRVWTKYRDKIIYDRSNDNIDVYHHKHGSFPRGNSVDHYPYLTRFDLVLKKRFLYKEDGGTLAHDSCRVIN